MKFKIPTFSPLQKIDIQILSLVLLVLISIVLSVNIYLFLSHNKSSLRVEQVDAQSDALSIRDACRKSEKQDYCMAQTMSQYAKNHELSTTLSVLDALKNQQKEPLFCHLIAHKISIAEVSKNPDNWAEILSKVDINDCTRVFFH